MMHDWRPPERLDSILDDCIDHLDTETPEELLRSYPHSAPELAPLLHVAAELAELGDLQMPSAAREAGRARLREAVLTQQRRRRPRPIAQRALRMATWAALLLVVFGTGLSAVTVASASALPNDRLYGWKRASERVWVGIQPSTEQTVEAALWVADRRVGEMQQLYQRDGTVSPEIVAELKRQYQFTLTLIAAAPPSQEQALLERFHTVSETHTQALITIAQTASGDERQVLMAAAQVSQWAQTVTLPSEPSATPPEEGTAPSSSDAPGASQDESPTATTTPTAGLTTAVPIGGQPGPTLTIPPSTPEIVSPVIPSPEASPTETPIPRREPATPRVPSPTNRPEPPVAPTQISAPSPTTPPAAPINPTPTVAPPPSNPTPEPGPTDNPAPTIEPTTPGNSGNPGPPVDPGPPGDPGNPNPPGNPGNPNPPGPPADPGPTDNPGNPNPPGNPGNPNPPGPPANPGPTDNPGNPNPPGPPSDPGPPSNPAPTKEPKPTKEPEPTKEPKPTKEPRP